MKRMFVLKESKDGNYFVFSLTEHLRRMVCSILEINICSQDLRSLFTKRLKKTLLQSLTAILFRSRHQRCSIKKLFLKVLQYSQENTCVGVSF